MKVVDYMKKLGVDNVELQTSRNGRLLVFEAGTDSILLFCSAQQTAQLAQVGELGDEAYMAALGQLKIGHCSEHPDWVFASAQAPDRVLAHF